MINRYGIVDQLDREIRRELSRRLRIGVICGLALGLPVWIATVAYAAIVDNGDGTATYSITASTRTLVDAAALRGWLDMRCDDDSRGEDWPVTMGICPAATIDPLPVWECTTARISNGFCHQFMLGMTVPRASPGLATFADGEITGMLRDVRDGGIAVIFERNKPAPDFSDPL